MLAATMQMLLLLLCPEPISPRLPSQVVHELEEASFIDTRHATESGPGRTLDATKLDRYGPEVSGPGKKSRLVAEQMPQRPPYG